MQNPSGLNYSFHSQPHLPSMARSFRTYPGVTADIIGISKEQFYADSVNGAHHSIANMDTNYDSLVSFREFSSSLPEGFSSFREKETYGWNVFKANDIDQSGHLDVTEVAAALIVAQDTQFSNGISLNQLDREQKDLLLNPYTSHATVSSLQANHHIAQQDLLNTLPPIETSNRPTQNSTYDHALRAGQHDINRVDQNGDGELDVRELAFGEARPSEFHYNLLNAMDLDNSQTVSAHEAAVLSVWAKTNNQSIDTFMRDINDPHSGHRVANRYHQQFQAVEADLRHSSPFASGWFPGDLQSGRNAFANTIGNLASSLPNNSPEATALKNRELAVRTGIPEFNLLSNMDPTSREYAQLEQHTHQKYNI